MYFVDTSSLYTGVIFAEGEAQVTAQHKGERNAGGRIAPDEITLLYWTLNNKIDCPKICRIIQPRDRVNKVCGFEKIGNWD